MINSEIQKKLDLLENRVRKLEEKQEPKCKFKVGDKVIVKCDDDILNNSSGTITKCEQDYYFVTFDDKALGSVWISKDRLTTIAAELKCKAKVEKFKIGDKVKEIINNRIGTVKTIIDDWLYKIEFNDDSLQIFHESWLEAYTEPRWTFTDDEKTILRNLPSDFNWIARDRIGNLTIYCYKKPHKNDIYENWVNGSDRYSAFLFNHLFQSIKWEDTEACEFRKYL